ncbi:MAG: bifunctional precorrin-2 dehydrogenase/sirohydrochlorin ferrochelatase [Myxococcales bacterium]
MTASHPSYAMHVRLTGRPVLVAGAGRVATRKIERLVESGARVQVVAHEASGIVSRLAREGKLELTLRGVQDADARDKFLVIAATDDPATNANLAQASRALGVLVSRVDAPEDSDFTVPAVARGECVEATVSTAGAAPSASRRLGKELARWVSLGPDRFAKELASVRRALRGHPESSARLRRLSEGPLFEACARGDAAEIASLREIALSDSSTHPTSEPPHE